MDQTIVNTTEKANNVLEIPRAEVIPASGTITVSGAGVLPRVVDYTLYDTAFGKFEVLKSSGAGRTGWWEGEKTGSGKLNRLIEAFKAGHIIKDALFYAGISQDQWAAFNEVHPQFAVVKEACESYQTFGAMDAFNAQVRKDGRLAWEFLKSTHPRFKKKDEDGALMQQTLQVSVSQNVDTTKIEAAIARAADAILAERG